MQRLFLLLLYATAFIVAWGVGKMFIDKPFTAGMTEPLFYVGLAIVLVLGALNMRRKKRRKS